MTPRQKRVHGSTIPRCTSLTCLGAGACVPPLLPPPRALARVGTQPLTGPMADFEVLSAPGHEPRVRYESAVGAGTPFVATVARCVKVARQTTFQK